MENLNNGDCETPKIQTSHPSPIHPDKTNALLSKDFREAPYDRGLLEQLLLPPKAQTQALRG